jgi:hypothetical protein
MAKSKPKTESFKRSKVKVPKVKIFNLNNPVEESVCRNKIIQLMKRGFGEEEIAGELGLEVKQVVVQYKIAIKEMAETRSQVTEEVLTLKLKEYQEVKKEAWLAWEKSKNPIEKEAYETITSEYGTKEIAKRFKEGRLPASEYLNVILQCLKAERELLGINPVRKIEGSMTVAGVVFDWNRFMDELDDIGDLEREAEDKIYEGLPKINAEAEVE